MRRLFICERATEHSNNTVMGSDWCQWRAASVSRNQSRGPGPPSPSLHCSADHWGLLTPVWPHSISNAAGSFTDSEDSTMRAGLLNAKPRLTSWPLLAPAFCGRLRTGVDVSWPFVHGYWCGIILVLLVVWSISKFIFSWHCWLPHTNKDITAAPIFSPHTLRFCALY